jgi:leader peptidase (prepilin peptidase)/N-methyltransferase
MTAADIPAFLLILTSPAIGSFIAVLADRLPRGEDVILAPSRCRSCGSRLGLRDLVPMVSFALQRGRCRHCNAAIPPFSLYVEILALGAAVLAVLAGGGLGLVVLSAVWLWLLLALATTDALWMRLPDPLTFSAFCVACLLALQPGGTGLPGALWGAVLGAGSFAMLRWIYKRLRGRVGLGLGDVKLMAGLGAFVGPVALPQLVLIAALATLTGAVLTRKGTNDGLSGTRALPFGTALCFSAALIWLWSATV